MSLLSLLKLQGSPSGAPEITEVKGKTGGMGEWFSHFGSLIGITQADRFYFNFA